MNEINLNPSLERTRKWHDTWETLCLYAGIHPEYELNDHLLKEVIYKIYYNNFRHCIAIRCELEKNMERKLLKTVIAGDNTPHCVCFAIQGSPPKGTIFVFHPDESNKEIYFYDGKMKPLIAKKYSILRDIFFREAKNVLRKKM